MNELETITLATAIAGAVGGVVGTVLGVINLWDRLNERRVRLKVVPRIGYEMPGGVIVSGTITTAEGYRENLRASGAPQRYVVEVINLSRFAVTVDEVGWPYIGGKGVLVKPDTAKGQEFPARLEPREAVTLYGARNEEIDVRRLKRPKAFATTACGVTRYGSTPLFREHIRQLKAAAE